MNWWQRLLRRDRLERELDAEIRFHIDHLVADYMAAGLSEPEARRRAMAEFGAVERIKDDCRDARGTEWVRDMVADARIGGRLLKREPAFSAVAIAALALGLGVNTVFFSIVNTYCLTGLPFPAAEGLVVLSVRDESGRAQPWSAAQARAVASAPIVDAAAFYTSRTVAVRAPGSVAERRTSAFVSPGALTLIGEAPAAGRLFTHEEYTTGAPVVVISAALAAQMSDRIESALGRTLIVDGVSTTVTGVMPAGSNFPDNASVWQPLAALGIPDSQPALTLFARLTGAIASNTKAQAQLDSALRRAGALADDRRRLTVTPLNDSYRGRVTDPVWIAFITAGALVVLIACSNVGNLLLARGARRHVEIAIRLSVGATRLRILRQLLTETLVLVAAACVAAAIVAWTALRAFRAAVPSTAIPYWSSLDLDWRSAGVLAAVGLATILLAGLAPAVQLVKVDGAPSTTRTTSAGRGVNRWSAIFLTVQLALSVVLLCAVGITVQVYRTLAGRELPGRVAEVLSAQVAFSPQRYPTAASRERVVDDLRRTLRASGQVTDISVVPAFPGSRGTTRMISGGTVASGGFVGCVEIDPEYFSTLGVPLLTGHELSQDDRDAPGGSVLVNERLASLLFGDVAVAGRAVRFTRNAAGQDVDDSRIVAGVVPAIGGAPGLNAPPIVYVPRARGLQTATVLLRGAAAPAALAPVLRDVVAGLDPDVPLSDVLPLTDASWQARWNGRVSQALITTIASIGLVLALVGVGALTSHRVAVRARELSIRVALGARPSQLIRAAVAPVLLQLAFALVVGALLARAWQRAFNSPIATADNIVVVCGVVSAATLIFSLWPARLAAHANPMDALRGDG